MYTNENKKTCCFYVNEIHLEIMILPYIDKKIEEKEKIYLINETNLNESVNNVINKINLEEVKKEKILKLEWNNENFQKLQEIEVEKEKAIVFVNGSEEFNKKINEQISKKSELEIVNCYNLFETHNVEDIKNNYNQIINTTGIKEFE